MWTYILRRLLIMVPTLFGVTVVSFLIMQLAPGDPLLMQLGSGGTAGQSSQTRESFLLQKRDLKLDKPILLNFNRFRDYTIAVRCAAYFESLAAKNRLAPEDQIAAELDSLSRNPQDREAQQRLAFLRSLKIPDFEQLLGQPEQHPRLARAVDAYVNIFCEDTGADGVPPAIEMLHSDSTDPGLKIGVLHALARMVPDPFIYTYSRRPTDAETPLIEATWRIWWERSKHKFAPLEPERHAVLTRKLESLSAEPSRERMFAELESYDRDDTPFFAETLLGSAALAQKVVAAQFLRLYNAEPLAVDVPRGASPQKIAEVAANWLAHYDARRDQYQPPLAQKIWSIVGDTQYAHMVWRLVTFNFGRSALKTAEPVSQKLWDAIVVSAPLVAMAELLIYLVAVPLGIVCAVNRGRWLDRFIAFILFLLYSIPPFVAGMLFLLFFCYGDYFRWFPMQRLHSDNAESFGALAYALDYAWHAVLPVTCLSLFSLAGLAMYARTSMLDVIGQDFVRTARAKGVSETKVIFKHVLRNGLIPILTLFSNFLPAMLGGSVLVEVIFDIPGMGRLGFNSIDQKDFPTLMALIYVEAIVVLASILMTDLIYVLVDPRISFESQAKAA